MMACGFLAYFALFKYVVSGRYQFPLMGGKLHTYWRGRAIFQSTVSSHELTGGSIQAVLRKENNGEHNPQVSMKMAAKKGNGDWAGGSG